MPRFLEPCGSIPIVILLLASPEFACAADESPVTTGSIGREAAEAVEGATRYSLKERAQIEQTIQAELDDLQAGMQRLQSRIDQLSGEARTRAEASLADLERCKEETRRRFLEIGIAGEVVWDRLRQALESSMEELRQLSRRTAPSK